MMIIKIIEEEDEIVTFFLFCFLGQVLLKEWCKYRYGIFPENGFPGDKHYPEAYQEGNKTLANRGCVQQDVLCPLGQVYNRVAPTKQNLLCNEQSGIETVLNHQDFQTTWESVYAAVPNNKNEDDQPVLDLLSQFTNVSYNETTTTSTTTTTTKPPTQAPRKLPNPFPDKGI